MWLRERLDGQSGSVGQWFCRQLFGFLGGVRHPFRDGSRFRRSFDGLRSRFRISELQQHGLDRRLALHNSRQAAEMADFSSKLFGNLVGQLGIERAVLE
jgi:hypothetical protein